MKLAYVDTSCVVAIALGERGGTALARRLTTYDRLLSANLLEAELGAALAREGVETDAEEALAGIDWVFPQAPLSEEIAAVLEAGYARGADVWHLASALWARQRLGTIDFLTLDTRQRALAGALGLA